MESSNFTSSPNIIRMIKSMRITWERHAAHMTDKINTYKIFIKSI